MGLRQENEAMRSKPSYHIIFSAIEAIDTELGRVIESIPNGLENTIVIFLGDNGTLGQRKTPISNKKS